MSSTNNAASRAGVLIALALATLLVSGLRPTLAQVPAGDRPSSTQAPPVGFTISPVASLTGEIASDVAVVPDGRLLATTKSGRVRVVQNGALVPTPALDLNALGVICTDFERGLHAIEADPAFASNQYVYISHTYNGGSGDDNCGGEAGITNRIVRYTLTANNTLANPTVILGNIASPDGNHNGGDLHFGADGYLYISTGDGGNHVGFAGTNLARYRSLLNGKILRINPDGSVPASNPFYTTPGSVQCGLAAPNYNGGVCRETFAWGFRNPFRFAIRHGTNEIYVNDVGQNAWEEISAITAGGDYGWFCREGALPWNTSDRVCVPPPAGMIDPIYTYAHGDSLCAITGAAFAVSGGVWPAPYENAYYFGDYCGNTIYRLTQSGGTYQRTAFATVDGDSIVALAFDPASDTLYFTTRLGEIGRIDYTGDGNRAPTAKASATPTSGLLPLQVQFSSAGSSDPDGDALSFGWNFGDGSPTSSQANPAHTYASAGVFLATLIVTDSNGTPSPPVQVKIYAGNTAPEVEILAPTADLRFQVGQVVTLTGYAVDAQDGNVSASLEWNVLLHHVPYRLPITGHTHPFFSGSGNNLTMPPLPNPEDLDAAPLSYLEIQVTARDSTGLTQTVTQTLQPRRVPLTFATDPGGLRLIVGGVQLTSTQVITTWHGHGLIVSAPTFQQDGSRQWWKFKAWSNGGAAAHTLTVPGTPSTYVASYEQTTLDNVVYLPAIATSPPAGDSAQPGAATGQSPSGP